MKSIKHLYAIAIFSIAHIISLNANAQKIYVSIENGFTFGDPSNQIGNAFRKNGFGDTHYWNLDLFGWESSDQKEYPKTTGNSISIFNRIRCGYKLGDQSAIEINFAMPRKSRAEGYDVNFSNFITFENKVTDFSLLYVWNSKKKNIGIGAGAAISLFKLDIKGETETETDVLYIGFTSRNDSYSIKKNYIQAGIATTAYWRLISKPVFFMDLRSDLTYLSPVKTPAIDDSKTSAQFPSIRLNNFFGDVNIAFGIKF